MKTLPTLTLVIVILAFYLNSVKLHSSGSEPKEKPSSGSEPKGKLSSGSRRKGKACINSCQCPNGRKRCQECECRSADQCVKLANNSVICNCSDSGYTGVFCETKIVLEKPSCPEDWIEFRNRCYGIIKEPIDWASAQAQCESRGAILVEGENNDYELYYLMYFYLNPSYSYWVGLTDQGEEGNLIWYKSNVPVSEGIYSFLSYTNYQDSDCVFMRNIGLYVDNCDSARNFVCELDL